MRQATLWGNPETHLDVVRRLYVRRFNTHIGDELTLQQVRGMGNNCHSYMTLLTFTW